MKKKIFLVFILFLTWLNYLLSYEYVKIMMDTADGSKVSNTMVLLIFPIMWNYGAALSLIMLFLIAATSLFSSDEKSDSEKGGQVW